MEEPVCEPPAIAMYYVSKLASKHVKVLLSGEGGDEAFAGYSNYRNIFGWSAEAAFPALNSAAAGAFPGANSWLHSAASPNTRLLTSRFPEYYYSRTSNPFRYCSSGLGSLYSADFLASIDREYTLRPLRRLQAKVRGDHQLDAMLYIDTKTWLPDDLLVKADKMTMANSLELRVPLLDHKVLEFAASLAPNSRSTVLLLSMSLKRHLRDRLPGPIRKRRKAGFPVPYESWLRNELSGWVREVLFDRTTMSRSYFDAPTIRHLLERDAVTGGYSKEIFSLVTLELWQRTFLEQKQSVPNCAPGSVGDMALLQ